MLNHVNTVLIGKTVPSSYTTVDALVEGDVALFDGNHNLITSADNVEKVNIFLYFLLYALFYRKIMI